MRELFHDPALFSCLTFVLPKLLVRVSQINHWMTLGHLKLHQQFTPARDNKKTGAGESRKKWALYWNYRPGSTTPIHPFEIKIWKFYGFGLATISRCRLRPFQQECATPRRWATHRGVNYLLSSVVQVRGFDNCGLTRVRARSGQKKSPPSPKKPKGDARARSYERAR